MITASYYWRVWKHDINGYTPNTTLGPENALEPGIVLAAFMDEKQ